MFNLALLFVTAFSVGLCGAMIPGPLFLFTVSRVLKGSVSTGVKIIFGHVLFEAIVVALILVGLHPLLHSKALITAISVVGGVALIVMGVIIFFRTSSATLSQAKRNNSFTYGAIAGGAFFSVVSPGFLIWWATIGTPLLLKSFLFGLVGVAVFLLGHWFADVGWYWFVSYSVDRGKHLLSDRSFHTIMKGLALALIILGIFFGLNGVV